MQMTQIIEAVNSRFPGAIVEAHTADIVLKKEALTAVVSFLQGEQFFFESLHCMSAVDRGDKIELVYHLFSFERRFMLTLKVFLALDDLSVATLSGHWKSANWLEREIFDLFGVTFLHHPDLRRILNPQDWTVYPLRKSFEGPHFHRLPQTEGLKSKGQ